MPKIDFTLEIQDHVAREIVAILLLLLAVVLYLSMYNLAGEAGKFVASTMATAVGAMGTYLTIIVLALLSLALFAWRELSWSATRFFGLALLFVSALSFIQLQDVFDGSVLDRITAYGGWIGFVPAFLFSTFLGSVASKVITVALFMVGLLISFDISIREIYSSIRFITYDIWHRSEEEEETEEEDEDGDIITLTAKPLTTRKKVAEIKPGKVINAVVKEEEEFTIKALGDVKGNKKLKESAMLITTEAKEIDWTPPSFELLEDGESQVSYDDQSLKKNAEKIRDKLAQFGIEVSMKDIHVGPAVTQYTLKPSEGVKLSKITTLKNDLALALASRAIRIEAPIPGKSLVGIEIANDVRVSVRLKELLMSDAFYKMKSNLRLPVGRNVSGEAVIADLAKMPHLLIAGATGSGKSVGMNAFLMSLLYQNSPEELRLILVDPKRVELDSYNNIPHLLTPVITDPHKALNALRWAVAEMTRRYKVLQAKKVRSIHEYNEKELPKMPIILVVVDELADLMMGGDKKEVEGCICRLAQMARAVGMHLIIATQRPSVDVITGLIKANFPARIAYTVTSQIDSRTILDCMGAEDLLGQGDMLFLPGGMSDPLRVQGTYVSSKEIERVTSAIRLSPDNETAIYDDEITSPNSSVIQEHGVHIPGVHTGGSSSGDGDDDDTMVQEALELVRRSGKASASLFQRHLKVGYARAARLIDMLEARGYVGPADGAKPRSITSRAYETEGEDRGVPEEI